MANNNVYRDLLNRWYYETHFPEIFAIPNGPQVGFRFKNANESATFHHLTLVPLPSLALVDSPDFKNAKYTYDLLPKSHLELAEFDIRYYEKVRTFEDQISKDGRIGKCLVAISIDSDKSDETEKDFDAWYRLQQPDMLSVIPGYRRTTCYKLKEAPSFSATNSGDVPRYLALHEYDSTDIKSEHIKSYIGTQWSKEALSDSRSFIRDVWITIHEQGREGLGL
ncbi:unnamed protein product [Clonostachys rhizophaga]|uniref:Uncharacterized protein n=1 Tax=Clonostachys rhizophaga TaxID=160324 RepID=A0A9N9VJT1_9HYPO|nr:unnamed protein product [Clonostachys rhizophaga]